MKISRWTVLILSLLAATTGPMGSQPPVASQSSGSGTAKSGTSAQQKSGSVVHPAMTNRDIIRLVQAKIADDLIIAKIAHSKTRFDTSTEGLIALKEAGVSDRLIAVMMNPEGASASAASRLRLQKQRLSRKRHRITASMSIRMAI